MHKIIYTPTSKQHIEVELPYSKSIANRMLILAALANKTQAIQHFGLPDDVEILEEALANPKPSINVGIAGTCMRFLTAYFAVQPNIEVVLTGAPRMKERPIAPLVNALRMAGATIEYLEHEGYPPIKIQGANLQGGDVEIDASVSSQFISALLLVGPKFSNGLHLKLQGELVSAPYLQMTIDLLSANRIHIERKENSIYIAPNQQLVFNPISVERDWSAAAYWYSTLLLHPELNSVFLTGLAESAMQGDAQIATIFKTFGIETKFEATGTRITKTNAALPPVFEYNFIPMPDQAQTFAVLLSALRIPCKLTGLQTLLVKETNRIEALANELESCGHEVQYTGQSLQVIPNKLPQEIRINTYNDHRMAMAFAPICFQTKAVRMNNAWVVNKSYPQFWQELKKAGVEVLELDP